jgi:hypothetical protein
MYVNRKSYARLVRTMHYQVLLHKRVGGAENDRFVIVPSLSRTP